MKIIFGIREGYFSPILELHEFIKAKIRMFLRLRALKCVKLSKEISMTKCVLVVVLRNERIRLPYFFSFYRNMGISEFIVIDNDSTDDSREFLLSQSGVTIYETKDSYSASRFGVDWVNIVLSRHCCNKWVLFVDADEFLVFPGSDRNDITYLISYLESRGDNSLNCLMIDMYSKNRISMNLYYEYQNPFAICAYYDRSGYYYSYNKNTKTTWIKGGVRGRNYFDGRVWDGPALNKTPLIFWKWNHTFLRSAHMVQPFSLNKGSRGEGRITGALLHAKFLSDFVSKVSDINVMSQHTNEYNAYINSNAGDKILYGLQSKKYDDWKSLARDGLIQGPNCSFYHDGNKPYIEIV